MAKRVFKPLYQMNGDSIQSLKKPITSEMKQQVRGQNAALKINMKKKLNIFYKDQLFVIGKMQRGQHSVYGTMLRAHADRKRIEREARLKKNLERERLAQESFTNKVDEWLKVESAETDPNNEETRPNETLIKDATKTSKGEAVDDSSFDRNGPVDSNNEMNGKDITKTQDNGQSQDPLLASTPLPVEHIEENPSNSKRSTVLNKSRKHTETSKALQVNRIDMESPISVLREKKLKQPELKSIDERETSDNGLSTQHVEIVFKDDKLLHKVDGQRNSSGIYIDTSKQSRDIQPSGQSPPHGGEELEPLTITKIKRKKQKKQMADNNENTCPPFAMSPEVAQLSPLRTRRRGMAQPPPTKYLLDNQRLHEVDDVIQLVSEANGVPDDETRSKIKRRTRKTNSINYFDNTSVSDVSNIETVAKGTISLIEMNKIYRKRKQRRLQEELSLPFTEYMRNSVGDIVPSLSSSKRKEYRVPSGSEGRRQQRMLDEERNSLENRNQQIRAFYVKLEIDEEKRQRVKTPQNKPVEVVEKIEKMQDSGGFMSNYLFAAFKQEPLPKGLEPNSEEAMLLCKYVRAYKPKARRKIPPEGSKNDRISSWNPVGFVAAADFI